MLIREEYRSFENPKNIVQTDVRKLVHRHKYENEIHKNSERRLSGVGQKCLFYRVAKQALT